MVKHKRRTRLQDIHIC